MSIVLLIAALVSLVAILIFLGAVGLSALKKPMITGYEGMVGECGIVRKAFGFRGRPVIEIRGELWWCRSDQDLIPGQEVRVVSHDPDSPILVVEPLDRKGV